MSSEPMAKQLQDLIKQNGFTLPDRGMDSLGEEVEWRNGVPDYTTADLYFFRGKSRNHSAGSLEMVVENLVKKWEMEITHFVKPSDCTTMQIEEFKLKVNNGNELEAKDIMSEGSYNPLLKDVSKELYDSDNHTFESSQGLFRNAFVKGFGWELLQVFSGPPKVGFTWRHWGEFTGEYKGRKGDGRIIEMYGFSVATVNEDLKLTRVEVYFKPEGMLKCFEGQMSSSELFQGKALFGSCCPIHKDSQ